MNELGATTGGTATITLMHLILIAILALAAIAAIAWGMRLKRARVAAEKEVEAHAEEAGVPTQAMTDAAEPEAAPVPPPPPAEIAPAAPEPDRLSDEPIAAASDANLAAEASAAPALSSPADGPVTQLKGLGPKVAARLAELGVTTVGQLAALDDDQAASLDARLGNFTGRMERDRWIEQARFLASGDVKGFEAVFGRL